MEKGVRADQFTQPGDPMRIDYGYRYNSHARLRASAVAWGAIQRRRKRWLIPRSAFARHANSEFAAITEGAPAGKNSRHQFTVRLFNEQKISVVPLPQVEVFAERLQ